MSRQRTGSASFDLSEIDSHPIRPRQLQTFSVHYSSSNRWVATINVGDRQVDDRIVLHPARHSCLSFTFETEREAKRFSKSYAPPRLVCVPQTGVFPCCFICKRLFQRKSVGPRGMGGSSSLTSSASSHRLFYLNCRNCGVAVCGNCCVAWSHQMIPKTYLMNDNNYTVRVCKSCDWLGNAFCIALLRGRLEDAKSLHDTGNVNLRSSYPDIRGEAMFPVHCAVIGGNLDILRWLVDTHGCPIRAERSTSGHLAHSHYNYVLTSKGRSVLDLALAGKEKIDILRYLVAEKNIRIQDAKDPKLALVALDAMLRQPSTTGLSLLGRDIATKDVVLSLSEMPVSIEPDDISSTIEDACALCCEKTLDCVLVPCGHQMCCADCGHHLDKCPVCKVKCSVLKVFRT